MKTTVYENGRFHTFDTANPVASAMVVRGERIVAVGTIEACREVAGSGAEHVDLGGAVVIPGMIDSHIHLAQYARGMSGIDLKASRSLDGALRAVAQHAAGLPAGAWVTGGRWDRHRWDEPKMPCKQDLDRVVPDHPVVLPSVDGHLSWVNSRALELAGINRDTPDPDGGVIERDAHGEPTGILRENADGIVRTMAAEASRADLPAQVREAIPTLLRNGLTGMHDIDGMDVFDAFHELAKDDALAMRVHKLLPVDALDEAIDAGWATGDGDRWVSLGPVKLFADGALGSCSCMMTSGFAGDPHNHGIAVTSYDELLQRVRQATSAGIAVATHAIGDDANRTVLRAYARGMARSALGRLRMRVEHTQFVRREDVPLFRRLGVIASMQPIHCTSDIALNESLINDDGLVRYGWSTLLGSGACVTFGSDAPVEDPNPWHGVHAAVTRCRPDGTPIGGWQPHERITVEQALKAYTVTPAFVSYEEHLKGRLIPGMLADFVVLDDDPFDPHRETWFDMRTRTTVVGGKIRWSL